MSNTIYDTDFAECLPEPLKRDKKIYALAKSLTDQLLTVSDLSKTALIYDRIDEMPEALLDILAYDFHCDWYDAAYPIETKRKILKHNVIIHKRLGTKYAVEQALTDVYGSATVQEWFNYDEPGDPYHFKINVTVIDRGITEEEELELERKMWFYKNLRSHCDGIFYSLSAKTATVIAESFAAFGAQIKVKPKLSDAIRESGRAKASARLKQGARIKAKPTLSTEITANAKTTAIFSYSEKQSIKAKPKLPDDLAGSRGAAITASTQRYKQGLKIKAITP